MEVLDEKGIERAASLLKGGEVVAFATETVYGLGAPIFNAKSIEAIFRIKGRAQDNPLIAHVSNFEQIERITSHIPQAFLLLYESFFPGPLTVILPVHPDVPKAATAGLPTIGVRMPHHPLALQLIDALGEPIVAPSANISGRPSATRVDHVIDDFEGKIAAVVDGGECAIGLESTVLSLIDPENPQIYRPGALSKEALEQALQMPVGMANGKDLSPLSPGMKYRHYAPNASVLLFESKEQLSAHIQRAQKKRLILTSDPESFRGAEGLSARTLFHFLREADRKGCDEVLVLLDEELISDGALMNRLLKASQALMMDKIC